MHGQPLTGSLPHVAAAFCEAGWLGYLLPQAFSKGGWAQASPHPRVTPLVPGGERQQPSGPGDQSEGPGIGSGRRGPRPCLLAQVPSGWLLAFKTTRVGSVPTLCHLCQWLRSRPSLPCAHFFMPGLREYPYDLLCLHSSLQMKKQSDIHAHDRFLQPLRKAGKKLLALGNQGFPNANGWARGEVARTWQVQEAHPGPRPMCLPRFRAPQRPKGRHEGGRGLNRPQHFPDGLRPFCVLPMCCSK